MANYAYVISKNPIDYDFIVEKAKSINEEYFLNYLKLEFSESERSVHIGDPNEEKDLLPDGFYMFIDSGYFLEDKDAEIKVPAGTVDNCIASPHRQVNRFYWYAKKVFEHEFAKEFNEKWLYDEGVGWYKIDDTKPYHKPISQFNDRKEFLLNLKEVYNLSGFGYDFCLPKKTMKFFGLRKQRMKLIIEFIKSFL